MANMYEKTGESQDSTPQLNSVQNIVLVGCTGNGKSATGNSIARQDAFISNSQASGVTEKCESFRVVTPEGPTLNVIDTPGLFDMTASAEYISREIIRCLNLAEGGIHAVLLVLSVTNRVTEDEEKLLSTLRDIFGSKIADYLIVGFTSGDLLEEENETIEKYLEDCPAFLKRLLRSCGQRKIVFNNKTEDEAKQTKQVHEFLHLIDLVREHNKNIPYTNETYVNIKEETERYKKEVEDLESKNHLAAEELEAMKKGLQETYERNLKAMAETMEKQIKAGAEGQEKSEPVKPSLGDINICAIL